MWRALLRPFRKTCVLFTACLFLSVSALSTEARAEANGLEVHPLGECIDLFDRLKALEGSDPVRLEQEERLESLLGLRLPWQSDMASGMTPLEIRRGWFLAEGQYFLERCFALHDHADLNSRASVQTAIKRLLGREGNHTRLSFLRPIPVLDKLWGPEGTGARDEFTLIVNIHGGDLPWWYSTWIFRIPHDSELCEALWLFVGPAMVGSVEPLIDDARYLIARRLEFRRQDGQRLLAFTLWCASAVVRNEETGGSLVRLGGRDSGVFSNADWSARFRVFRGGRMLAAQSRDRFLPGRKLVGLVTGRELAGEALLLEFLGLMRSQGFAFEDVLREVFIQRLIEQGVICPRTPSRKHERLPGEPLALDLQTVRGAFSYLLEYHYPFADEGDLLTAMVSIAHAERDALKCAHGLVDRFRFAPDHLQLALKTLLGTDRPGQTNSTVASSLEKTP